MTTLENVIYDFTKIYTLIHFSVNNHIRVSLELVLLRDVYFPQL